MKRLDEIMETIKQARREHEKLCGKWSESNPKPMPQDVYIAKAIHDSELERIKPIMDSSKELIKYVRTKYNVSDNEKLSCPYMVKLEQAIKTVAEGVSDELR